MSITYHNMLCSPLPIVFIDYRCISGFLENPRLWLTCANAWQAKLSLVRKAGNCRSDSWSGNLWRSLPPYMTEINPRPQPIAGYLFLLLGTFSVQWHPKAGSRWVSRRYYYQLRSSDSIHQPLIWKRALFDSSRLTYLWNVSQIGQTHRDRYFRNWNSSIHWNRSSIYWGIGRSRISTGVWGCIRNHGSVQTKVIIFHQVNLWPAWFWEREDCCHFRTALGTP